MKTQSRHCAYFSDEAPKFKHERIRSEKGRTRINMASIVIRMKVPRTVKKHLKAAISSVLLSDSRLIYRPAGKAYYILSSTLNDYVKCLEERARGFIKLPAGVSPSHQPKRLRLYS